MNAQVRRRAALLLLGLSLSALLSGCWDKKELDMLFIVTGVALDAGKTPEEIDITLQVGRTNSDTAGTGDVRSQENPFILLKAKSDTIENGIMDINRDSSRTVFLHHNQVVLFGAALAQRGIRERLDLFMRNHETRLEVPVVVAEGRAEKVLATKMDQDKLTGLFLARLLWDLHAVSPELRVRLLDVVSRLLDGSSAPVATMFKIVEVDGKDKIRMTGLALFHKDQMVGSLNNAETHGYIWAMGNVEGCGLEVKDTQGRAVLRITRLDSVREVGLRPDGGARASLSVTADLGISELVGFQSMDPLELISHLSGMAEREIRRQILETFAVTRRFNTDIYRFGVSLHRKYPQEWKAMKERWDELYPDMEMDVRVKVKILGTGKTVPSLEMEEKTS